MDLNASLIALGGIVPAVAGALLLTRSWRRQLREETGHADQVRAQLTTAAAVRPGDRADPGNLPRRRVNGFDRLAEIARRETEIYVRHHELALKHHAAYQAASLWAGVLGFAIILAGAVLTYVAGLDVGAVTALAGAIPSAASALLFQQAKVVGDRASENLRALEAGVRRFNALNAAKALADEVSDSAARDRMYEQISRELLDQPR